MPLRYEPCRGNKFNRISASDVGEIFRDLSKSAPHLHTLCIGDGFPIHEDFLYDTGRLRRVELNHCEIRWDSRLLTRLTRLTLRDSLKANTSVIQVSRALQRMPALTEFHLVNSLPDDSGGASTIPVVDLPCLRMLHISSWVGPLTTFLRHITFSHSAILNLTCKEKFAQIDFSNFLSVLATKFCYPWSFEAFKLVCKMMDTVSNSTYGQPHLFRTAFHLHLP